MNINKKGKKNIKLIKKIAIALILLAILEFLVIGIGVQYLRQSEIINDMQTLQKWIIYIFENNQYLTDEFIKLMNTPKPDNNTAKTALNRFEEIFERCKKFNPDILGIRYFAILPDEEIKHFDEKTNQPLSLFCVFSSDAMESSNDIGKYCVPDRKVIDKYKKGKKYTYNKNGSVVFYQFPVYDKSNNMLGYIEIDYNVSNLNKNHAITFILQAVVVLYLVLAFYAKSYFSLLHHSSICIRNIKKSEWLAKKRSHDFKNHIQTIYALLSIDDVKETKNYIENLVRDISSVQKLDYCKHPFALFLYTKIVAANANEIEVVMDFDSAIFSSIKIPSIHLVDVIGNLLDNAIEASNELPKEERLIEIQIQKKYESIVFVISNNGSVEDYMEKIFLTGFSTKEKGKGLGLPIARDTVAMLDGKLELTSYSPVVLEVTLPNKKSS